MFNINQWDVWLSSSNTSTNGLVLHVEGAGGRNSICCKTKHDTLFNRSSFMSCLRDCILSRYLPRILD